MSTTIRIALFCVLTTVAATSCQTLQSDIANDARPLREILRLDPDARASWNDETGDIAVFGRLGALESGRTARDFLLAVDVPRLPESAGFDLVLHRERTDPTGWQHLTYRQEIGGLRVWDQRLTVHIDPTGEITAINGRYVPARVAVTPRTALEAADAVAVAVTAAGSEPGSANLPPFADPELVIHSGGGVYRAAWTFALPGTNENGAVAEWRYFVDAQTGAVLERFDEVETIAATGSGIDCNLANRSLNLFEEDSTFKMSDVTRSDRGGSIIETRVPGGDLAADDDATWDQTEVPVRDGQQAEVSIHYWLGAAYDRLFELTGREGWDDDGRRIPAFAHFPNDNNASYSPNKFRLTFGESEGSRYLAFGCANDIVAHEYMHGIVDFTAGLNNDRDPNAMDESFSDMLGLMVDRDNWLLGEDAKQSENSTIRDVGNPAAVGHPSHYGDVNSNQHESSNITSHAFYLAAAGLRHTGDSGYRCDVSLGRDVTFDHFYYALENFLQPKSTMPHLAAYVEYIATSILGVGRDERADVFAEAFRRVGLSAGGEELACAEPWFWVMN